MKHAFPSQSNIIRPRLKCIPESRFSGDPCAIYDYLGSLNSIDTDGWRVDVGGVGPLRQLFGLESFAFHSNVNSDVRRRYGGGDYVLRIINHKGRHVKWLYLPIDFSVRGEVQIDYDNPILCGR